MLTTQLDPKTVAVLASLEGLISEEVGLKLAELAAGVPAEQAIVELGSYKGKSTAYLAAGAMVGAGAIVHAVDPWDLAGNIGGRFHFNDPSVRQAFDQQVARAGVADRVAAHRGFSVQVARSWQAPIGLLYIDGSHLEADVRADFDGWYPYLAPSAVVAFDDYRTQRNPGVARVVDALTGFARWEFAPAPLAIGWLP